MKNHGCPTCGSQFETRRGLGVHHSSAHDQRLPNRECDNCGEQFYCSYERKYCSESCHDEAIDFSGKNNPNYKGGKETTQCAICDDYFDYYPSDKEGLYCPKCVEEENWRDPPLIAGEDHPRWSGGKIETNCAICDASIERYPSHVNGEVALCSDECRYDWLSDTFTGDGHPNWEGGGTNNYGKGWNRVRRQALERDNHECVVCGTTGEELGRNPDVHHIVPVRLFDQTDGWTREDAHDLNNVVSLCPGCHRSAEFGNIPKQQLWDAIDIPADDRLFGP